MKQLTGRKLDKLLVREVDFHTATLKDTLPGFGASLTVLEIKEVWRFKYTNFRAIKYNCPNLETLVLAMTSQSVLASMSSINVDRDCSLQLNSFEKCKTLPKLKGFFISGPFESDVIKYFIYGADQISAMTLAIEWMDATYCNVQPQSAKDFLGT